MYDTPSCGGYCGTLRGQSPSSVLQAYWPFHKAICYRNEFADATQASEPKFAQWMRKHQKMAVLKDDEVDRIERASKATTGTLLRGLILSGIHCIQNCGHPSNADSEWVKDTIQGGASPMSELQIQALLGLQAPTDRKSLTVCTIGLTQSPEVCMPVNFLPYAPLCRCPLACKASQSLAPLSGPILCRACIVQAPHILRRR